LNCLKPERVIRNKLSSLYVKSILTNVTPKVELTEDDVVSSVISELRPTVIAVIRATVESAGVNLGNPESLVKGPI
jgi:hypothetical protein